MSEETQEKTQSEMDALLAETERLGVKPAGPSLAELRWTVRTAQLLAQAKACREYAAETLQHWAAELDKAWRLEKDLQNTLRASLADERPAVVGSVGVEALGGAQTNVAGLSAEAQSALIDAENGRVAPFGVPHAELGEAGLTRAGALTPKGEAARALLVNRRLDEAFGPLA